MEIKVIAVEENLPQISEYLRGSGFQTVNTTDANVKRAAAVVISGADKDVLGMEAVVTGAPVINARGLTPEEVLQMLNSRMR